MKILVLNGSPRLHGNTADTFVNSFLNYLKLEDMGIFSAYGRQNHSEEKLKELREFGQSLKG